MNEIKKPYYTIESLFQDNQIQTAKEIPEDIYQSPFQDNQIQIAKKIPEDIYQSLFGNIQPGQPQVSPAESYLQEFFGEQKNQPNPEDLIRQESEQVAIQNPELYSSYSKARKDGLGHEAALNLANYDKEQNKPKEEKPGILQQTVAPLGEIGAGILGAGKDFMTTLDEWAKYLSEHGVGNRGGAFADAANTLANWQEALNPVRMNQEQKGVYGALRNIYSGLGRAAVDLPLIAGMKLPAYSAMTGGAGAITGGESTGKGVAKGFLEGLLLHGILKGISGLPFTERVLAGASIFGGPALAEELKKPETKRDYSKVAAELFIGAGLTVQGRAAGTRRQLIDDIKKTYSKDIERIADEIKSKIKEQPELAGQPTEEFKQGLQKESQKFAEERVAKETEKIPEQPKPLDIDTFIQEESLNRNKDIAEKLKADPEKYVTDELMATEKLIKENPDLEEIYTDRLNQLKEVQNAIRIRNNEGKVYERGIERERGVPPSGSNIQQPSEEGRGAGIPVGRERAEEVKPPEAKPDAVFIGMQEDGEGNEVPMFNITKEGHPKINSTVSEEDLLAEGLKVPEYPKPKMAKIESESITKAKQDIQRAENLMKDAPVSAEPLSGIKTKTDYKNYIEDTQEWIDEKETKSEPTMVEPGRGIGYAEGKGYLYGDMWKKVTPEESKNLDELLKTAQKENDKYYYDKYEDYAIQIRKRIEVKPEPTIGKPVIEKPETSKLLTRKPTRATKEPITEKPIAGKPPKLLIRKPARAIKELLPEELSKLTKDEKIVLFETKKDELFYEYGKIGHNKFNQTIEKLKARKLAEGEEYGIGKLTDKGKKISEYLKKQDLEERQGIPIEKRIPTKPIREIKPFDSRTTESRGGQYYVNKINGEEFYTNGEILLKGRPKSGSIVPKDKTPDFDTVIPKGNKIEIKPIALSKLEDHNTIWFSNGQTVVEKYYDFIKNKFPNAIFKSVEGDWKKAITIYENKKFVGLLMPTRINEMLGQYPNIGKMLKPEMGKEEIFDKSKMQIFRISEDTEIKNISGKTVILPKGEEYRTYDLGEGKVKLQDGKQVTVYEGELNKLKGQILTEGEQPRAGGIVHKDEFRRLYDESGANTKSEFAKYLISKGYGAAKTHEMINKYNEMKAAEKSTEIPKKDLDIIKETSSKLIPGEININKLSVYKSFKKSMENAWTNVREFIQDDWYRVKKLVDNKNWKMTGLDPYQREILYKGRIGARLEEVNDTIIKIDEDIVNTAKKIGIENSDLINNSNAYLIAKHVPERNEKLGKGAAGMSTHDANETIKILEELPHFDEIKRISGQISDLNKQTLKVLLEGQVIDKETYDLLHATYKNHVPLNRVFGENEDIVDILVNKGLDVKWSGLRRAVGSQRKVADILTNVVVNYEQAIVRAEKNLVDLSTLKFARENNYMEGLFEEIRPPRIPVANITHREVIDIDFFDKVIKFAESMGAKISTKGQPGRRLGYFKPPITVVRKLATPREILSHEVGHFFDNKYGLKTRFYKRGESRAVAEELINWMKEIGKSNNRMKKTEERFADGFEWWLTNRALAKEDLPLFSREIEKIISEIPDLKPLLEIRPSGKFTVQGTKEIIFRPSAEKLLREPTVLALRENGKSIYLKINDPHLAVALRGVNRYKVDGIMRGVGTITRWFASLATRFNPEFAMPNKIRDLQEAVVYALSKKEIGIKGSAKLVTRDPASQKAILDYLRGKDSGGARLYKQMKMDGGTTGGLGLSTRKALEIDVSQIRKTNRSNLRKAAQMAIKMIENWNTIFEDSTRLSIYKEALARGISRERAAVLAKEGTINFNKMGRGGPVINALYMFSNASVQGSAKMMMAMKNPKVTAMVVGSLGIAVASIAEWNNKNDPEWRDKISKWDKLNGLSVVIPSSDKTFNYITIPVSWGIKPIKVGMDYICDLIDGQENNLTDAASGIFVSFIEAYNPIGGTEVISGITPTILDLPIDLARNKKWSGSRIRPDYSAYVPHSLNYYKSLKEFASGEFFINETNKLSEISGGRIELSPADINYSYEQIIGGAGRSTSKVINTFMGIKNKKILSREIPFVSRFYRSTPMEETKISVKELEKIRKILTEQSRERIKEKQEAETYYEELKKLPKEQSKTMIDRLNNKNKKLGQSVKEIIEEERLGLTYSERLIKQLGVESGERAKYIKSKLDKLSEEERNNYYQELKHKKIITKKIDDQIQELSGNQNKKPARQLRRQLIRPTVQRKTLQRRELP